MTRKQVVRFTGSGPAWPAAYVGFYSDSGATTPVTVYSDQIAGSVLASGKTGSSPVRKLRADNLGTVPPPALGIGLYVDSAVTTLYARPETITGVAISGAAAVSVASYGPDGPVTPPDPSSQTGWTKAALDAEVAIVGNPLYAPAVGSPNYVGIGAQSPTYNLPPQPDQTMWAQDFAAAAVTGAASSNLADTDVLLGSKSASVVTDGAGTFANLSLTGLTAVDFTGRYPKIWVKVDDPTKLSSLKVILGTGGFTNTFNVQAQLTSTGVSQGDQLLQAGVWEPLTLGWDNAAVVGSPNRASIDSLRIQVKDTSAGAVTVKVAGVAYLPEPSQAFPGGVITLCFDDGYASQFSTVRPYLDKYGMPASAFPIVSLIDSGAGWMTTANLKELQDKHGWEVCGHAFTQADHDNRLTSLTTAQLAADFAANRAWLSANGFRGVDISAWPGGIYSDATKQTAKSYFSAFRGVLSNSHESFPPADPYVVRGYPGDNTTGGPTLSNIEAAVDACVTNKTWLVLVLHDIQASPSANSIQWSTANFQALIDYIATRGVPVRTFGDVLREKRTGPINLGGNWTAEDHGKIAWSYDPVIASTSSIPTSGLLQMVRLKIRKPTLITNVELSIAVAGATLTAGQCFAGLWDSKLNLLAITADQSTNWQTAQPWAMPLATPQWVNGDVYVGWWWKGTTGPSFARQTNASGQINMGLATASSRFATSSSGLTTTAPNPAGALSLGSIGYFAAVS